jgi:CheY-like chemotaxis protein
MPQTSPQTSGLPGAQQSVLVVDDDLFSQEVFRKALAHWGVSNVHMAGNGREATRVLEGMQPPPDFLICDIFMPDMDGIEFVAVLAKQRYRGGLILVTGGHSDMLEVAQDIATMSGLRVLGTFIKPLLKQTIGLAMGLAALPVASAGS